jgi:cell division protein FtsB
VSEGKCIGTFVSIGHLAVEWCSVHKQQARACSLFDEVTELRAAADKLSAEVEALKEKYDTLHDQRHAEARAADKLRQENAQLKAGLIDSGEPCYAHLSCERANAAESRAKTAEQRCDSMTVGLDLWMEADRDNWRIEAQRHEERADTLEQEVAELKEAAKMQADLGDMLVKRGHEIAILRSTLQAREEALRDLSFKMSALMPHGPHQDQAAWQDGWRTCVENLRIQIAALTAAPVEAEKKPRCTHGHRDGSYCDDEPSPKPCCLCPDQHYPECPRAPKPQEKP